MIKMLNIITLSHITKEIWLQHLTMPWSNFSLKSLTYFSLICKKLDVYQFLFVWHENSIIHSITFNPQLHLSGFLSKSIYDNIQKYLTFFSAYLLFARLLKSWLRGFKTLLREPYLFLKVPQTDRRNRFKKRF